MDVHRDVEAIVSKSSNYTFCIGGGRGGGGGGGGGGSDGGTARDMWHGLLVYKRPILKSAPGLESN